MTSQCTTTKLMNQIVRKFSQNLFQNHIRNPITMFTGTISGEKVNKPFCESVLAKYTLTPIKNLKNQNFLQNAVRRIHGLKEIASDIRRYSKTLLRAFPIKSVSKSMSTNSNKNLLKPSQQKVIRNAFRPIHGFSGAHTVSTIPILHPKYNIRFSNRILLRTFATSSVYFKFDADFFSRRNNFENKVLMANINNNASKHFAVTYDFPIIPIPTKSKRLQQPKKAIKPIAQNYMPLLTMTDTKNLSEKVYRKIGSSGKSLIADLLFSFPFDTHSDVHKSNHAVPKFDNGKMQETSLNLIADKLSSITTSRNSIWSIGNNFSFPSISRRFEVETTMQKVEESVVCESEENSTNELDANI